MNNDIKNTLQSFIDLEEQEFHRFNSWKTCYQYFQNTYFKDESDDDTAALHLGFYLASWGMYRGSTFLLQNDYTIHIEVVKVIKKYSVNDIYDFSVINEIKEQIIKHYYANAHKNSKGNNNSTDTLITKILLGTLGSVPAYDRFFVNGIALHNRENPRQEIEKKFSKKGLLQLNKFYIDNINEFEKFESKFPKMKLVDMYFWKLGFDNE
ncbi:MAG: hypothetical protein PHW64_02675 [Sulfuricurvum sp.]|nr:hypothetical protein [Sulfuricurvum sp.]